MCLPSLEGETYLLVLYYYYHSLEKYMCSAGWEILYNVQQESNSVYILYLRVFFLIDEATSYVPVNVYIDNLYILVEIDIHNFL